MVFKTVRVRVVRVAESDGEITEQSMSKKTKQLHEADAAVVPPPAASMEGPGTAEAALPDAVSETRSSSAAPADANASGSAPRKSRRESALERAKSAAKTASEKVSEAASLEKELLGKLKAARKSLKISKRAAEDAVAVRTGAALEAALTPALRERGFSDDAMTDLLVEIAQTSLTRAELLELLVSRRAR